MVINVGQLQEGNYDYVFANDIKQVVNAAHNHKAICKVILETALVLMRKRLKLA